MSKPTIKIKISEKPSSIPRLTLKSKRGITSGLIQILLIMTSEFYSYLNNLIAFKSFKVNAHKESEAIGIIFT